MKKGDIISYGKNDQLALSWKDKRVVTMLITKHKGAKMMSCLSLQSIPILIYEVQYSDIKLKRKITMCMMKMNDNATGTKVGFE